MSSRPATATLCRAARRRSVACAAGPGLAFIAYPEGIAMMPLAPFWSALFFVMLFTLGVDSQFGLLETGVTALVDEFAVLRRGRRKVGVVAAVCVVLFVLGLPQCSPVSRRRSVVCLSVCVRSLTSSPRPTKVGVVAAVCVALFVLGLPQCSPVSRRRFTPPRQIRQHSPACVVVSGVPVRIGQLLSACSDFKPKSNPDRKIRI